MRVDNLNEEDVIFFKEVIKTKTGYEDYYDDFEKLLEEYNSTSDNDIKEEVIDKVIDIYYKVGIFPMKYLSKEDMRDDLNKLKHKEIEFNGEYLKCRSLYGLNTCRMLVQNIHKAKGTGRGIQGELSSFCSRKLMRRTVRFVMKSGEVPLPNKVRRAFALTSGSVQNFSPMRAKVIYDYYTNNGDIVYDFSSGFGGRMLGALCSKNNLTYIGIEPNTETYNNLSGLLDFSLDILGKKENKSKIYKDVSEEFTMPKESIDFAFSSPPYFDVERYCEEETQCYIKYPEYDNWLEGYVRPTLVNIYNMLKSGKVLAVNVANNKNHNIKDDWQKIAEEVGFTYETTIVFDLSKCGKDNRNDKEGILIFRK